MKRMNYSQLQERFYTNGDEIVQGDGYYAQDTGAFWQIAPSKDEEPQHNGWKFHLSVHPDDVPRAWDLVYEDVMRHELTAKVTNPAYSQAFGDEESPQKGKMITIYDDDSHLRDWQTIMQNVEHKFQENGIRPGPQVNIDQPVRGSSYASYRNDRDKEGVYIPSASCTHYNMADHPDPHAKLDMNKTREHTSLLVPHAYSGAGVYQLNCLIAPVRQRYDKGIANSAQGWEFNPGRGGAGETNLRLPFYKSEHADEVLAALEAAGINACRATKRDTALVMLRESDFDDLTPESYKKAQSHLVASRAKDVLAEHCQDTIPPHAWYVDPGKGGASVPNVRVIAADAEQAFRMSQRIRKETGLEAEYAEKPTEAGVQHMVLLRIHEPLQTAQRLDDIQEFSRDAGLQYEQQQDQVGQGRR